MNSNTNGIHSNGREDVSKQLQILESIINNKKNDGKTLYALSDFLCDAYKTEGINFSMKECFYQLKYYENNLCLEESHNSSNFEIIRSNDSIDSLSTKSEGLNILSIDELINITFLTLQYSIYFNRFQRIIKSIHRNQSRIF